MQKVQLRIGMVIAGLAMLLAGCSSPGDAATTADSPSSSGSAVESPASVTPTEAAVEVAPLYSFPPGPLPEVTCKSPGGSTTTRDDNGGTLEGIDHSNSELLPPGAPANSVCAGVPTVAMALDGATNINFLAYGFPAGDWDPDDPAARMTLMADYPDGLPLAQTIIDTAVNAGYTMLDCNKGSFYGNNYFGFFYEGATYPALTVTTFSGSKATKPWVSFETTTSKAMAKNFSQCEGLSIDGPVDIP